ncbi:MAG: hypothetical protein HGA44_21590 [Cellulomonadaceae bacterium]|nr:hypothetical protein [Cellulomonadaceae bacterium]
MSAEFQPTAARVPERVENLRRGALFALATIPVGVLVWVVLWSLGFIASLVAAMVAFLAMWLYVRGAGRLSRAGAVVVVVITVTTLMLAFFGGIVLDFAVALGEGSGLGTWGAFVHERFWPTLWAVLPDALPEYLPDFAWAVGFGALGSFATLRGAFAATRPVAPAPVSPEGDSTAPDVPGSPGMA